MSQPEVHRQVQQRQRAVQDADELRPRVIRALGRIAEDFTAALEAEPQQRVEIYLYRYAIHADDDDGDDAEEQAAPRRGPRTREMPFVFPARSPSRMRQIAQLFRVLEILLESLRSGVVVTKRDIYYRDSALFSTQGVVDRLVEQLAVSMRVERHQLGVVASPRGLFSGNVVVSYLTAAGRRRDVAAAGTAKLVPSEGVEQYDVETGAPWMLIIEKEASFRRICDDQRGPASPLRDGIIVTAKGYPDYATSAFVAVVARRYPWMRVLALVDGDPFGIDIWRTYQRQLYAALGDQELGRIEWLGLRPDDYRAALPGRGDPGLVEERRGLLPLSHAERQKAVKLLRGLDDEEHMSEPQRRDVRLQLSKLLLCGHKAEIEWLEDAGPVLERHGDDHDEEGGGEGGGLVGYLRARMMRRRGDA